MTTKHRIFTTPVAKVYPYYIAKAEKKGQPTPRGLAVACCSKPTARPEKVPPDGECDPVGLAIARYNSPRRAGVIVWCSSPARYLQKVSSFPTSEARAAHGSLTVSSPHSNLTPISSPWPP